MREQIEKVKNHIVTHKEAYIASLVGFVIGGVTIFLIARSRGISSEIIDMSRILSPGDNNVMKVFISPLGDPGNVVQCVETGTVYASQGQAAKELGVDASVISRHLNGIFPDIKGNHLIILGKAGKVLAE